MTDADLDDRAYLDRLNAFLADVYREPHRLSDVLRAGGLGDDEIERLRRTSLPAVLEGVRLQWCSWLETTLVPRYGFILVRRYGLDGQQAATLAALGQHLTISRERVRQLKDGGLRRLRRKVRLRDLEQLTAELAREVLTHGRVKSAPNDAATPANADHPGHGD